MKIDWKKVSQSPGYKSLKAAYVHDLRKGWRSKRELLTLFKWVIGRAKHYAHHRGTTIDVVLDEWESNRDYWWLNYYGPYRQKRLDQAPLPISNIKTLRREIHKTYRHHYKGKTKAKRRMCTIIQGLQEQASVKSPKRWTSHRKQVAKRRLKYL